MKTLITLVFFLLASFEANAQDIYSLISNGEKRIHSYNFHMGGEEREDHVNDGSYFAKGNLEKISSALEASGFEYDHLNDTLLVVIGYQDYLVTIAPSLFFIKSSKSTKNLEIQFQFNENYRYDPGYNYSCQDDRSYTDTYKYSPNYDYGCNYDYHYNEYIPKNDNEYEDLMYSGNVVALQKVFAGYISPLDASEIAVRIVLKDGKIVYPSLAFYY